MRLALVLIVAAPLVHAGDVVDVAAERNLLVHGHVAEQQQAIMRLASAGENGSVALVDIIENEKDWEAKGRAGMALQEAAKRAENQNDEFFKRVRRIAENEDANISYLALTAAANLKGNNEARKLIKAAAKSRREPKMRAMALNLLHTNAGNDKSEIPFFAEFLKDPSEYVRVWAAGFLGDLGDARALQFVNEVLRREPKNSETKFLIMRAAIAAGSIGDASSLPLLKKIGESTSNGVARHDALLAIKEIELKKLPVGTERIKYIESALYEPSYCRWAVFKLSQAGSPEAVAALQRGAQSKNSGVSVESTQTLMAMGIKVPER